MRRRYGTFLPCQPQRRMSAFGGKADIASRNVKCPLMTQSGHRGRKVLAFKPCMRRGPYGGHMQRRQFIALLGGAATLAASGARTKSGSA